MTDARRDHDQSTDTPEVQDAPRDPDRTKLGAPMFVPLGGWLMRTKPKPDENGEIDPAWLRTYESEILYSRVKFVLGLVMAAIVLLVALLK